MTQAEALQAARQHIETAFHLLCDSGMNPARAYEYLMGTILTIWSHTQGLVTHAILSVVR
jgi:hypothetical protein